MNSSFIKKIDELGRIVIPKDIRYLLKINSGDLLSICSNNDSIIMNKYNSINDNTDINKIYNVLYRIINKNIIITNSNEVIVSNLDIINNKIDEHIQEKIINREIMDTNLLTSYTFNNVIISGYVYGYPIITSKECSGMIIINDNNLISDEYKLLIKYVAEYIASITDIT